MNLSLAQKGLILVSCILLLELGFVGFLGWLLLDAENQINKERQIRDVITHLYIFSTKIADSTSGLLMQLDLNSKPGTEEFYLSYYRHVEALKKEMETLKSLFPDSEERKEIEELVDTCNQGIDVMEKYRVAYHERTPNEYLLKGQLHLKFDDANNQTKRILQHYQKKQEWILQENEQSRSYLLSGLCFAVALNVVLAIFLSWFFTRAISTRLRIVSENTQRFAANAPLHPPLGGADEISSLDRAFRSMAAAVSEADRKEHAVVDHALDVICTLDANDTITAINPACLVMLGYTQEELVGRRYSDLVVEADRKKTRSALAKIVQEQTSFPFENRLKRKDGSLVDVIWNNHWSPDEKALFCVIHDISSRREVERLKQEFVDMVSHDLKTPLSAIKGTLALLSEGVIDITDDGGKRKLDLAQSSADRLMRLVNDLLDIERLEGGQLNLVTDKVGLRSLIDSSVESVRPLADEKELSIVIDAEDIEIIGDEDRLVQVLVNLLSNAVKFSSNGKKINVEGKRYANVVEIKVKDQGRGIPPDAKEVLFHRFRQVESVDGKKGTGLGLVISKGIVEAHGGTIGVHSELGQGSEFWIRLPLTS